MIYETTEEIAELLRRFDDCTLPEKDWTHAAHLTVALRFALHHDFETALAKMRAGIHRLNEAHGVVSTPTSGYHETITVFWMRTVFDYLAVIEETSLVALCNELIKTRGSSNLPLEFYSRARLFSVEARAKYIEPDLANSETKQ